MTLKRREVGRILDEFKAFVLKHQVLVYIPEMQHFQTPTAQQLSSGDLDLNCWLSMVSFNTSDRHVNMLRDHVSSMIYMLEWKTNQFNEPEYPILKVQLMDYFILTRNLMVNLDLEEYSSRKMFTLKDDKIEIEGYFPKLVKFCDGNAHELNLCLSTRHYPLSRSWQIAFYDPHACNRRSMKTNVNYILAHIKLILKQLYEAVYDIVPSLLIARELGID